MPKFRVKPPIYVERFGVWKVDEGNGCWSEHTTEDAAWTWIERLGTFSRYETPVRQSEGVS